MSSAVLDSIIDSLRAELTGLSMARSDIDSRIARVQAQLDEAVAERNRMMASEKFWAKTQNTFEHNFKPMDPLIYRMMYGPDGVASPYQLNIKHNFEPDLFGIGKNRH